jgi:hypothetical protein
MPLTLHRSSNRPNTHATAFRGPTTIGGAMPKALHPTLAKIYIQPGMEASGSARQSIYDKILSQI